MKKSNALVKVFCSILFLAMAACFLTSCSTPPPPTRVATCPPPQPVPEFGKPYDKIDLSVTPSQFCNPRIYVYKGERRLMLVDNRTLVRDYPIGLGPNPTGDKLYRGDGRTPEGEYFICKKNPSSKFYKSLGISYPSPKHASTAYMEGRITADEYRKIIAAQENMTLPPYDTPLGGAIFIHGGGSQGDWTLGCIALSNSVMDELFQIIPVGTPVEIHP